jgi:hypothetical protein
VVRLDLGKSSPELQNWNNAETGENNDKSAVGWSEINTKLDLRPSIALAIDLAPTDRNYLRLIEPSGSGTFSNRAHLEMKNDD